ncbi:hypothetical protein STENM36S_07638 [Streptomyces tendae]
MIGPTGCCPSGWARSPRSLICSKIFSASASMRSVSCSMNQEPPSGSATLATPVSSISTCWVRRAISAACSLGRARVSSSALVCRELVPPSTAASASTAARTTLLYGCCAVSETPAVGVWQPQPLRLVGPRPVHVPHPPRPDPARRAELGDLLEEVEVRVEEEGEAGREDVHVEAAAEPQLHVPEAVGERVRQLLRGRRARLADVVPGDGERLVGGDARRAYSIRSPIRRRCGSGWKSHSFWAMYSLKMSVCSVPSSTDASTPCRSAATRYMQNTGTAGPLIVMEVVTSPSGMSLKRTSMSAAESMATPQCPTSPSERGSSESRPISVGMSRRPRARRRRRGGSSCSARWSARRCRTRRTAGWSTYAPGTRSDTGRG